MLEIYKHPSVSYLSKSRGSEQSTKMVQPALFVMHASTVYFDFAKKIMWKLFFTNVNLIGIN